MWHKVKDVAKHWDIDSAGLENFAADNQDNYAILMPGEDSNSDMEVNTWNVDDLVKDYLSFNQRSAKIPH